eukprot:tig00021348_g20530.t1
MARRINALRVHCEMQPRGCTWTGELGSLSGHKSACTVGRSRCSGCEVLVLTEELGEHEAACPRVRRPCENAGLGCEARVTTLDLPAHLRDCLRDLAAKLKRENENYLVAYIAVSDSSKRQLEEQRKKYEADISSLRAELAGARAEVASMRVSSGLQLEEQRKKYEAEIASLRAELSGRGDPARLEGPVAALRIQSPERGQKRSEMEAQSGVAASGAAGSGSAASGSAASRAAACAMSSSSAAAASEPAAPVAPEPAAPVAPEPAAPLAPEPAASAAPESAVRAAPEPAAPVPPSSSLFDSPFVPPAGLRLLAPPGDAGAGPSSSGAAAPAGSPRSSDPGPDRPPAAPAAIGEGAGRFSLGAPPRDAEKGRAMVRAKRPQKK